MTRPEPPAARKLEIDRVLALLRRDIPAEELDEDDWKSLRVAIRVVYETEALRAQLHGKRRIDREATISHWCDTLEACLEFMSWTKCLAQRVTEQVHLQTPVASAEALWQLHGELAQQLLEPKLNAGPRLCLLTALGGIELTLLGQLWWLPPSAESKPASPKQGKRRVKRAKRG